MRCLILFTILTLSHTASAQWTLQDAHTKASLRGIHSLGNGFAWASGTDGTVLRTEDGGIVWQLCKVPPGAEKLDFRGVQAFDNNTAIVMSSGKGDLSRLYKTTDGCQTWKLVFSDPDEEGFFDAIRIAEGGNIDVLGDSVKAKFPFFFSQDKGETWMGAGETGLDAALGDGGFAASNSIVLYLDPFKFFATSGGSNHPARLYRTHARCVPPANNPKGFPTDCTLEWLRSDTPLGTDGAKSGIYSLAGHLNKAKDGRAQAVVVAVGGNYEKPDEKIGTTATSSDGGYSWQSVAVTANGYRSSVAYDPKSKTWIAVGPNGTDISTDDGRNWRALKPGPNDAPDADKNWNALSLPFVVGPNGRIGVLRTDALKAASAK